MRGILLGQRYTFMGEKKVSYNRMLPSWYPEKLIINSLKNTIKLFTIKNNIVGIHILYYIVGRRHIGKIPTLIPPRFHLDIL